MFDEITFSTKIILPEEELDKVKETLRLAFNNLPIEYGHSTKDITLKELTLTARVETLQATKKLLELIGVEKSDINKLSKIRSYVQVVLENVVRNMLQSIGMNKQV